VDFIRNTSDVAVTIDWNSGVFDNPSTGGQVRRRGEVIYNPDVIPDPADPDEVISAYNIATFAHELFHVLQDDYLLPEGASRYRRPESENNAYIVQAKIEVEYNSIVYGGSTSAGPFHYYASWIRDTRYADQFANIDVWRAAEMSYDNELLQPVDPYLARKLLALDPPTN
jgi:hypothetical protein